MKAHWLESTLYWLNHITPSTASAPWMETRAEQWSVTAEAMRWSDAVRRLYLHRPDQAVLRLAPLRPLALPSPLSPPLSSLTPPRDGMTCHNNGEWCQAPPTSSLSSPRVMRRRTDRRASASVWLGYLYLPVTSPHRTYTIQVYQLQLTTFITCFFEKGCCVFLLNCVFKCVLKRKD